MSSDKNQEGMVAVIEKNDAQLRQGDIISDVQYLENVDMHGDEVTLNRIVFPLVIVLTQDCDLNSDYRAHTKENSNEDKYLLSVLVAPLYNYGQVIEGSHLADIQWKMTPIPVNSKHGTTAAENLKKNLTQRYHYIAFPPPMQIVPQVIDFKHYFSVNTQKLQCHKEKSFVCSIAPIYRESLSQRFSYFLSRIGIPDNESSEQELCGQKRIQ